MRLSISRQTEGAINISGYPPEWNYSEITRNKERERKINGEMK